jgi:hypothetical protein
LLLVETRAAMKRASEVGRATTGRIEEKAD